MTLEQNEHRRHIDEQDALHAVLEGTSAEIGEEFFAALVKCLCEALDVHGAWVTEFLVDRRRLRALAFYLGDRYVDEYEYDIKGTPCEPVIDGNCMVHFPDRVIELFPDDPDLPGMNAVSYMGMPLVDTDGTILGHLALLDTKPLPEEDRVRTLFQIFANRAAAELQRLRAEKDVRQREEKLSRLVDSAMDAIIELDEQLTILSANKAAGKILRCNTNRLTGKRFTNLVDADSERKLTASVAELSERRDGDPYLWVPGEVTMRCDDEETVIAEATLSRFEVRRQTRYTVILRNVNDRIEAKQRIKRLSEEAAYLREELNALQNFDEILGRSSALVRVLQNVEQVAPTDATVLIRGETGTGKELFARAIHNAGYRSHRRLVKVNCAAIPASLMESEFFGHEKGAFTGATQKRDGRFALADGGTIFLDEIGELPLDVQAKLLRVLQEGEFEPVGSSETKRVDVRVIAATNRDLKHEIKHGRFREDLYYRLNVFPIEVPPLRERGDDVIVLAEAFAETCARRMGRSVRPLSQAAVRRLQAYDWPGNIRELQNVIERAVITSRDGRLDLDHAFPETVETPAAEYIEMDTESDRVYTMKELQRLEKENIIRALESCRWRVSGAGGAAERLGMKPTTLSSRIKALGITRR